MSIDFDSSLSPILKLVEVKVKPILDKRAKLRQKEQEEEKQRAQARRAAAERAERERAATASQARSASNGMPDMSLLYSDPTLMAGLKNPRVMGALQQLMCRRGDPDALAAAMHDPEVSKLLSSITSSFLLS
jgi:hypothetical protein